MLLLALLLVLSSAQTTVYDFTLGSLPAGLQEFCNTAFACGPTADPSDYSYSANGVTIANVGAGFRISNPAGFSSSDFTIDFVASYPTFSNSAVGGNSLLTILAAGGGTNGFFIDSRNPGSGEVATGADGAGEGV